MASQPAGGGQMSLSLGLVGAGHGPSAAGSVGASGGPPYFAADGTYRKMAVTGLSSLAGLPIRSKKKWEKSSRCKSVVRDRRLGWTWAWAWPVVVPLLRILAGRRNASSSLWAAMLQDSPVYPSSRVYPAIERKLACVWASRRMVCPHAFAYAAAAGSCEFARLACWGPRLDDWLVGWTGLDWGRRTAGRHPIETRE